MALDRRQLILSTAAVSLLGACSYRPSRAEAGAGGTPPPDPAPASTTLMRSVAEARQAAGLPALGVLAGRDGEPLDSAVDGVRARGADALATRQDRWHIGSCTKSMTATLLARYVERGLCRWDSRVDELLPDLAEGMDPLARTITLAHLLTATAGLPEFPSFAETEEEVIADIMQIVSDAPTVSEQRLLTARRMFARPPRSVPGTEWVYCSTGFIIAGAIAERIGGASYEELLTREVLAPLGLSDFGFGAPGSDEIIDQPRGHMDGAPDIALAPSNPEADNPAFFIPAGGLNITLEAWAVYAVEHARGERGEGLLLSADTYLRLHTPALEGGVYAYGWGSLMRDGRPALITHNGSNGAWMADIRIYPPTGIVYVMATNDGREDAAQPAFRQVRANLDERYHPLG